MKGATPLNAADIDAIERATFDAVPPEALGEVAGWLLGSDGGTVGRAHSAVPALHDAGSPACDGSEVERIAAAYAQKGLKAVFRVPVLPSFDDVCTALTAHGYAASKPTRVFVSGATGMLAALPSAGSAELMDQPDDAWRALFLGDGFDPVDGASRVAILGRAQHAAFACVRVNGETVAAGMGSYSHGWVSIHGMRTLPAHRGKGLASAILAAIAREGQSRGLEKAFLQVDASNTGAQSLYLRYGFAPAWDYAYWTKILSSRT